MKPAAVLLGALLVAACGTGTPTAATSPTPTAAATTASSPTPTAAATATPTAAPSPTPAGTPTPAAGSHPVPVSCSGTINPAGNLVLATLVGSAEVVLRDITNTAAATTVCTLPSHISPHFVTASTVSWAEGGASAGGPGDIVKADLATALATTVASWPAGGFGSGIFDWSPDGTRLSYIGGSGAGGGPTWHLVSGGADTILATLPAVPGRGVNRQEDEFWLEFSPDGLYLALVETFATGGSGATAPLQVRRASDGGLVYSSGSGTMGVWASRPSRLFFRDSSGSVSRWDPSAGVSAMTSLHWVDPHGSPDGRWIAYTNYDSGGLPHVGLYSVQGNSLGPQPAGLRSGATFLNDNLAWYQEETPCDCGLAGASQPSGRTFLYDVAGGTEAASRLSGIYDAWPRVTSPAGLG